MSMQAGYIGKCAVSSDGGSTFFDVGVLQDSPLTVAVNLINTNNHDDGGWQSSIQGISSASGTITAFFDRDSTGQDKILDAVDNKTSLEVRVRFREQVGDDEWEGTANFESYELGMPVDGAQSLSVPFQSTGSWTRAAQS